MAAIGSNNKLERMKTIKLRWAFLPIGNVRFRMQRRDAVPLTEAVPFWFAVFSPLIGLLLGFLGVWFVTWLTS